MRYWNETQPALLSGHVIQVMHAWVNPKGCAELQPEPPPHTHTDTFCIINASLFPSSRGLLLFTIPFSSIGICHITFKYTINVTLFYTDWMLCRINVISMSGEYIYVWITLKKREKIKKAVYVNENNHMTLTDGILPIDLAYRDELTFWYMHIVSMYISRC